MKAQSVGIIIVNWNGLSVTDECLQSLQNLNYDNVRVILVDNGSTDGSVAYFRTHYPEVTIIELDHNTGFTGGNNAGIDYVLGHNMDYVLLLNNDTVVSDPDFLSTLLDKCERDPKIGMACPTIFYDEPENKVWYAGGWLSMWSGWGHYHALPENKEPQPTGYATGCCLMVRSETVRQIGGLNEAYFLSVEDVEWSLRAQQNGWKTVYIPNASIIHKDSVSSGDEGKGKFSPTRIFYEFRNSIWFVRSYASWLQKVLVWPLLFGMRYTYRAGAYILLGRWEKLKAISKGFYDGIFTAKGVKRIHK